MKIITALLALSATLTAAPLELASPFSEHMVLQREMPVPVWGWGTPGEAVKVRIKGISGDTKVKEDGSWELKLAPLPTGGPYTFDVTSGSEKIHWTDVLVGEVWICSGQSNMQFGRKRMVGVKEMEADFTNRPIRSMTVPQMVAFTPQEKLYEVSGSSWSTKPCQSAVAFAFSYNLQKDLDVPVGVIVTCWGSSSIEGWMPKDMTSQLPHFKEIMKKFDAKDREKVEKLISQKNSGKAWALKENIYMRTRPNILYNAMMHPLAPYAARGMAWYQGEQNSKNIAAMLQYAESLKLWTKRLRHEWKNDNFHMLVVMLPKFGRGMDKQSADPANTPTGLHWAWMRESQLSILDLPHTGVVNTIDLGQMKNIHPNDKAPIGKRLALLAERDLNGKKIEAQGPTFSKATVQGKSITITFTHATGLTTTDKKAPIGFWIAGASSGDKASWHPASAKITGKNTITLQSLDVTKPQFIRYAFAAGPDVNLTNSAELPAVPFRTDSLTPR